VEKYPKKGCKGGGGRLSIMAKGRGPRNKEDINQAHSKAYVIGPLM